ncbi:MAG: hypothetical protein ACI39R_04915 [Lachnospiraceae bacterium]
MKKKEILLILSVIPIVLFLNFTEVVQMIFNIESENDFYQTYSSMIFNRNWKEISGENAITSMFGVVLSILCNFMFGIYIYKDLCISGTYYFVRQRNRKKWFVRKSLKVFMLVALYTFLQVFVPAVIGVRLCHQKVNYFVVVFVAFAFVALLVYNFLTTYLINLLALKLGSIVSFLTVYFGMALCFEFSFICLKLGFSDYPVSYFLPTEITQINLDAEVFKPVELYRNNKEMFISLGISGGYILLMFLIGLYIVDHLEISLTDRENLLG